MFIHSLKNLFIITYLLILLLVAVYVKESNVTIFDHLRDYKYIMIGCSFINVLIYIHVLLYNLLKDNITHML